LQTIPLIRSWSSGRGDDIRFIGRVMVVFGFVSVVFDFLTFGILQIAFVATPELFRTGWFVESLLTELVIAVVVRTRRPFFRSRPGKILLISTIGLVVVTFAIPYLPFASVFGFVPLPGMLVAAISGIAVLYVVATELTNAGGHRWARNANNRGRAPARAPHPLKRMCLRQRCRYLLAVPLASLAAAQAGWFDEADDQLDEPTR
jgi:hypothetical protein